MASGSASVTLGRLPDAERHRIVIAPNCSLTPLTATLFLFATGGATFLIAGVLAFKGLWPILPFAGLEIGLLVWATLHSIRRGRDHEIIEFKANAITIELKQGSHREFTVFPRHWAKVKLHAPQHTLHPSRLCLESHGRACEVGRFLTEDERRGLAVRLKHLIGNVKQVT